MKVDFQVTYTATCDIEEAVEQFNEDMEWDPNKDINKAIYDAVEGAMWYPKEIDGDVPQFVIEQFADALRTRIGGVQTEMEGVR